MSALVLETGLSSDSETFRDAAHNRTLADKLRADVAQAALGGNEKSRARCTSTRGKLLPCDRLIDPGSPFLKLHQVALIGQPMAGRS